MEMHEGWSSRPGRRGPSAGVVIFLALFFGLIGGMGGMLLALWAGQQYHLPLFSRGGAETGAVLPVNTGVQPVAGVKPGMSFANIADALNDSVVSVKITEVRTDPYSFFFGGGAQKVTGLGTGVIVDANGYILTNYHVVGEAKDIQVQILRDKNQPPQIYSAKLIGGDKQEDLALIKVDAHGLTPVTFGNSDALRPGDPVMAIGNPFGFEHTVSVGVVSALNRTLPVDDMVQLKHMIQTDASINPGNSGGPLVDEHGQVIGINSAVYVGNGNGPQANSIGFAIPSNRAKMILTMLRENKKMPYIGVSYAPITDDLRRTQRLPTKTGVMIQQVLPDSPAAKSGLKAQDIVRSADGKELSDQNALSDELITKGVGGTVTLDVLRWDLDKSNWMPRTIRVKIGEKPQDFDRKLQELQQQGQSPSQPQPGDDGGNGNNNGGMPSPFFGNP